jgi:hypothetical protein
MLSSTHSIDVFVGASGGLCLSPYNPTMALSNVIHMVCSIDSVISMLRCNGSSNSFGNAVLHHGVEETYDEVVQKWGPYET